MNRVAIAVLGGFVAVAAMTVVLPRLDRSAEGTAGRPAAVGAASASANAMADAEPTVPELSADPSEVGTVVDDSENEEEAASAAASGMPALGARAPKSLTFGVVFVSYAGAQAAPRNARPKADAETLANQLAELAKRDFPKAVRKGDAGSTEDAGKIYRDILEPPLEKALFSLKPGAVGGPFDTPRGFWIVRRIK